MMTTTKPRARWPRTLARAARGLGLGLGLGLLSLGLACEQGMGGPCDDSRDCGEGQCIKGACAAYSCADGGAATPDPEVCTGAYECALVAESYVCMLACESSEECPGEQVCKDAGEGRYCL